jgi:hypothetical protein
MGFGSFPYKRSWYLDVAEPRPETEELLCLLSEFKKGDFKNVDSLAPLMSSASLDVRKYALQLFADVCANEQVHLAEQALHAAPSLDEVRHVLFRLGETFSLRAIPLLLEWREELGDSDTDEYVSDALGKLMPLPGVDERTAGELDLISLYTSQIKKQDASLYFYRGRPIFVGDVTKELIVRCTVAYKEKRNCMISMRSQILSNFSGIECPVVPGQLILDADMENVFSYVQRLAAMKWERGKKYFFQYEVSAGTDNV